MEKIGGVNMYIIIAGGGILGQSMARSLSKTHDVVLIDTDMETCETLYSELSVVTINGDATNIKTLKDARIEKADYCICVMSNDSENLMVSLLAKSFDVKNIFVKMSDPDYEDAYKLAGSTNIASSVSMLANKFVLDIERPDITSVASFGNGKAEIAIIDFPKESIHIGKTIATIGKDSHFPADCIIAGIYDLNKEELIIPRGHCTVEENNQLFLVGSKAAVEAAYEYFNRKR